MKKVKSKLLTLMLSVLLLTLYLIFAVPQASKAATTVQFFSGTGDGTVYQSASTWDGVHAATNAYIMEDEINPSSGLNSSGLYGINRAFLPFNTADLPDNAVIQEAVLNVFVFYQNNRDNDGDDWITVVQTNQSDVNQLVSSDFDKCGSVDNPAEGIDISERKDISNVSVGQYLSFSLNNTGISWINETGWTKLGLREGHDVLNLAYVSSNSTANSIDAHAFDYPNDNKPYLEITYTVPEEPLWLKENTRQALAEIETEEELINKKLDSILEHMADSLEEGLWLDETHLDPEEGEKVFQAESRAVEEISLLLRLDELFNSDYPPQIIESKFVLSEEARSIFEQALVNLVKADGVLAQIAIDEASNIPIENITNKSKFNSLMTQAEAAMEKAQEQEVSKPNSAISHYKQAWQFAQKAMQ